MVFKRKGAKRFAKKGGHSKRKTLRRGRNTTVIRGVQPIPSRYICKQKYSSAFSLSVSNAYSQTMNLNSVFDPDRTGIGHQPYGFDQLASLYNRYRVISCSYVINAYNSSNPVRFGCLATNDLGVTPGGISALCEMPLARFKVQMPQGSTSTIRGKTYIPTLVGRNKSQYMADDRYQALTSASPDELALLYITAQTMVDSLVNVDLTVTLEYTVEYFDRKILGQS